jgi:hypothetical protein
LRTLLSIYLTNSGDPDINPPNAGQHSVDLELEIAGNDRLRVIKKEKKVMGFNEAMAYINSACERSQALLAFYLPTLGEVPHDENPITLTLNVIMQPLLMNTNAAAKTYVVSYPAVLEVCISKQVLGTGNRRGSRLRTRYILAVSHGHVQVHPSPLLRRPLRLQKGFHDTPETVIQHDSNERQRYFRRDTKYSN